MTREEKPWRPGERPAGADAFKAVYADELGDVKDLKPKKGEVGFLVGPLLVNGKPDAGATDALHRRDYREMRGGPR